MLGFLLRLADSNERPHFISIGFDWRRMAIVKKVTFLLDWPFLSPAAEKKLALAFLGCRLVLPPGWDMWRQKENQRSPVLPGSPGPRADAPARDYFPYN